MTFDEFIKLKYFSTGLKDLLLQEWLEYCREAHRQLALMEEEE